MLRDMMLDIYFAFTLYAIDYAAAIIRFDVFLRHAVSFIDMPPFRLCRYRYAIFALMLSYYAGLLFSLRFSPLLSRQSICTLRDIRHYAAAISRDATFLAAFR